MRRVLEENLFNEHRQNLAKTRSLITCLIGQLDYVINEKKFEKEFINDWKYIWGEKENAVSVLTKLTGLLLKVVPIEQELENIKITKNPDKPKGGVLTDDDKEIIRRYVARQSSKKV
jgi:hypothetical protein